MCVIFVLMIVLGGGFVRFIVFLDLWKILVLIFFFIMMIENLGLKIRNKMRDLYNFSKIILENLSFINY